jgi:hypothetical protein
MALKYMCTMDCVQGPTPSIRISDCSNLFSVKYYILLSRNAAFVGNLLPAVRRKCLLLSGHWLGEFFEQVTCAWIFAIHTTFDVTF